MSVMGEIVVLIGENISQLVGQTLGITYFCIDVGVRVSVYPIVDATSGYIILQFYGECPVCLAALKLWMEHTE